MKALKNIKWNGYTVFFTSFVLAALCFLPFLINSNGYFVYFGDYNMQQLPFYTQAHHAVRGGQFFVNMQTDLGSSLWSSYSFYLMGSPFFWITLLFPEAAIPYLLPWLLMLKMALSTLFAYFFIRTQVNHNRSAVMGALLYGFCGFQVMNLVFNHFADVIAFFPLFLLALDRLVQKRKYGVFALMTALSALTNYYFFLAEVGFLGIYFIVRYLIIEKTPAWKSALRCVGHVALELVVGALTSCILFLPSILAVFTNARVGQTIFSRNPLIYSGVSNYGTLLKNLFLPPDGISSLGLFGTTETSLASVSLFLPLFAISGVIAYFIIKRKKDYMKILLLVCAIFMLVPFLNSLFSGANAVYYARWFFMPSLFMAIVTVRAVEEFDKKAFTIGTLVCIAGLVTFFLFSVILNVPNKGQYQSQLIGLLVSLIFLIYLVWIQEKDRKSRYLNGFVLATIIVCGVCMYLHMDVSYKVVADDGRDAYRKQSIGCSFTNLPSVADDFYRVETSQESHNYPMCWNQPSTSCFISTIPGSIQNFYELTGITRTVTTTIPYNRLGIRSLLSNRYFMQNELYAGDGDFVNKGVLYGYKKIATENGFQLYENENALHMGTVFTNYMLRQEFDKLSTKEKDLCLVYALVVDNAPTGLNALTADQFRALDTSNAGFTKQCKSMNQTASKFTYSDTTMTCQVDNAPAGLLFLSIPYSTGYTATVDGTPATIVKVDNGLMAVAVNEGSHDVVFTYHEPGLMAGAVLSLIGVIGIVGLFVWNKKKKI